MSRPRTYPLPKFGDRFGKYTVICNPDNSQKILCRCDCGTERLISSFRLRNRPNISCGCDVGERISKKKIRHGNARRKNQSPEYIVWSAMMRRCYNPEVERYPRYGGRGIKVCDRWHTFENFLSDIGNKPSETHTIGRYDNDGHYEPDNCRWETVDEQVSNKSNNVYLEHNGLRLTVAEWSRRTGIPSWRIYRYKRNGKTDSEILGNFSS